MFREQVPFPQSVRAGRQRTTGGRFRPPARTDLILHANRRVRDLENWTRRSAHLGNFAFPRARGQVHLALSSDPAAIRDLNKTLGAPPVFSGALEGSLTDASDGIAIVQECLRAVTESPAFWAAYVRSRAEDCSKSRPRACPINLGKNVTCRPRTVGGRDGLERIFA